MGGTSAPDNSAMRFIKTLYYDPFKWSLVKSFTMFAVAVLFAREMVAATAEQGTPV